jgi:peptidoglycan/LPS O-acetylase OafA/YrhL
MGIYRFILSILVVISHSYGNVFNFNVGVAAVVSFFLLAGSVNSRLIMQSFNSLRLAPNYFLDRFIRIFPLFIVYLLLSVYINNYINKGIFSSNLTELNIFLNALIIPLGYKDFINSNNFSVVINPTWSLGLEVTFYLFLPLLIFFQRKIVILHFLYFSSMFVFFLSYISQLDSIIYGYQLIPGTLFIFLTGISISIRGKISYFQLFSFIFSVVLYLNLYINKSLYNLPFNKEILVGLILGIPLVSILKRQKYLKIDRMLGKLSYGIFLNHFIAMALMQKLLGTIVYGMLYTLILVLICTFLSLITYLSIELWTDKIRKKIILRM